MKQYSVNHSTTSIIQQGRWCML